MSPAYLSGRVPINPTGEGSIESAPQFLPMLKGLFIDLLSGLV